LKICPGEAQQHIFKNRINLEIHLGPTQEKNLIHIMGILWDFKNSHLKQIPKLGYSFFPNEMSELLWDFHFQHGYFFAYTIPTWVLIVEVYSHFGIVVIQLGYSLSSLGNKYNNGVYFKLLLSLVWVLDNTLMGI